MSSGNQWVSGWDSALEKHVLRSIVAKRAGSEQRVLKIKSKVTNAFMALRDDVDNNGVEGKTAFEGLIKTLSRELSNTTPNSVIFELNNFQVPEGTFYEEYLSTLKSSVMNAKGMGSVMDSTLQLAVWESAGDQFSVLTMAVFLGKEEGHPPYSSVGELLARLSEIKTKRAPAAAASRPLMHVVTTNASAYGQRGGGQQSFTAGFSGGVTGGGQQSYKATSQGSSLRGGKKSFGASSSGGTGGKYDMAQVMLVMDEEEADWHERMEFEHVYFAAMNSGRPDQSIGDKHDPPVLIKYATPQEKDRRRAEFEHRCLNCGGTDHYMRVCDKGYINASKMINPDMGLGTPHEVQAKWTRWQHRLQAWHKTRVESRRN